MPQTVTVNKSDLLATIKANRDEHRAIFETAHERYWEKVLQFMENRARRVRNGERGINVYVDLPEPVDYTEKYDEAIAQLEWEVADEVELNQQDFNRLVLNKWEWAQNFIANTQSYLAQ